MASELQVLLPQSALSRDGIEFDPRSDLWTLTDAVLNGCRIDWRRVRTNMAPPLLLGTKLAMLWYVCRMSLSHANNIYQCLLLFLERPGGEPLSSISIAALMSYRSTLKSEHEWKLATLGGFFRKFHSQGYFGVDRDVPELFSRFQLKANRKGAAVQTLDPRKGPFTDNELQSIELALNGAVVAKTIGFSVYAQALLTKGLGSRGVQYAQMKVKDLATKQAPGMAKEYNLAVPRGKQQNRARRSEFKNRKLLPEIGAALATQVEEVVAYAQLNRISIDSSELPMFPDWGTVGTPGFEHHSSSKTLNADLTKALGALRIPSERTTAPLNVTSCRFRYTVGTRAAEEGYGPLVIAELLDHTDLQSVGIYVAATPKIIDRIDRATAFRMAPLAQAFAGKLIKDRSTALRAGDPNSSIGSPEMGGEVGGCGHFGFCSAAAPIACYTCSSFEAWVDAPHHEVLDFLIGDRKRIFAITADVRVASVNDRSILAVARVIQLCEEARDSQAGDCA